MPSVIEYLKKLVEDDEVKGLKFIVSPHTYQCKKDKHDIFIYDDAIVYKEKKGKLQKIIPLHSCFIEVLN